MEPKIKLATGKDVFVRGDTLVLAGTYSLGRIITNSSTRFRFEVIVIDRIMPGTVHTEMLMDRDNFRLPGWEREYQALLQLGGQANTSRSGLNPNVYFGKLRKEFFKPVNRIRYLIANTSDNNQEICNGVLEKINHSPTQWEYNSSNCTVTKVGSAFDWDVEELLTNSHHEVRKLGKQLFSR